ncbi:MAG: type II/IV secretion system protein [Candidatus Omnitrophica bacterium]|nr:type II/IV secretion system protein [Candidatus Omnitrophota bacterium]
MKKLGPWLVERGLLTDAQLAKAVEQNGAEFLGTVLLRRGLVSAERLLPAMADFYKMPFIRLSETAVEPAALAQVPVKVAMHYKVMPVRLSGSTLTVAVANPQDVRALDELRLALRQRVTIEPVLAAEEEIAQALQRHYGMGADTVEKILADQPPSVLRPAEDALEDIQQQADDASVIKLVNQLIVEAHSRRATDIHLEPYRGTVKLRYRIDGMLHRVDVPPSLRQLFPAIISRIKVLSNLNIVERRLPQDGRASVKVGKDKLDLRISVLPTPAGESIVIRLLPSEMLLQLKDLGFRGTDLNLLDRTIQKPHGMILITGPTGSGKTTTLYACLNTINAEERKIITIEDPIEYELEGVTQVQVIPQVGLSFAQGLRSMLRHDPDVMMVGEVRDVETAELATRIALTGHLVFSTVHTNDAVSALVRFIDMGIDPFLIASSIECVIAQRLVRVLCTKCKVQAKSQWAEAEMVYQSKGCDACHKAGYLGRTAIYEFFLMAQPIRELLLQKAGADALRQKAVELGMRTMREDGWDKVKSGITSLDEVLRVTQDET